MHKEGRVGIPSTFELKPDRFGIGGRHWSNSNHYTHRLSLGYGHSPMPVEFNIEWGNPQRDYALIKSIKIYVPSSAPPSFSGKVENLFQKAKPPYLELEEEASVNISLVNQSVMTCSYGIAKNGPINIIWYYPIEPIDIDVRTIYPHIVHGVLYVEEFNGYKEEEEKKT